MENLDWQKLGFGYRDTDYNVRCYYRNGKWGELEISSSNVINIHMSATALHYGQEAFEGLKAFKGKDGKVRVFRMDENAKRMQNSADGILMQQFPEEKFEEAVRMAVKMNVHSSAVNRYRATNWCCSGRRVPVCGICNACWSLFP
jgi:branched-chain amino acid aminotransferase